MNTEQPNNQALHDLPPLSPIERIVYGFLSLLACLPLWVWRSLGWLLGQILYILVMVTGKRKHIALTNLRLCFPEYSKNKRKNLLRQHAVSMAQSMLDRIWIWHGSERMLQQRLHVHDPKQHLHIAQPVVLFTPHFAGLDAGGPALLPHVAPRTALTIYAPQANTTFDHWTLRGRTRYPNIRLFSRNAGSKTIVKALRQNAYLYLLADMDFGARNSIFCDFFGIPTATVPSVPRFAQMGRACTMSAVTFMEPHGYTTHIGTPWDNYPSGDLQADTRRMNADLENWIRQRPHEYFWLHKRFKTRPEGAPPVY